jgi:mono/diheme cytochrome c family protein
MIAGFLVMVIGTWLPLAIAARSRVATSAAPRIALMQDMYLQPKFRPQAATDVFADGRAMRLPVAGTIARGHLDDDDHFFRGFAADAVGAPVMKDGKPQFFDGYPEQVKVDAALLERGQKRFNIYCAVCHGLSGYGDGQVHRRVTELQEAGVTDIAWTPPANFHSDVIRYQPNGRIFNTINVGIRAMPGYGTQIPPADRWAIVAYIRALQLSQEVPPDLKAH